MKKCEVLHTQFHKNRQGVGKVLGDVKAFWVVYDKGWTKASIMRLLYAFMTFDRRLHGQVASSSPILA